MIRFIQLTLQGIEFNPVDLYVTPSAEVIGLFSQIATDYIEVIVVSFARKEKDPFMISKQFGINHNRVRWINYYADKKRAKIM
jgi:hypothetical protein